ncbi:MAG: FG-GAP repeat protein [Xanthomonadales bacterium]|nr:FG-GAP repeat protein [Xanthomonadales bacterium]
MRLSVNRAGPVARARSTSRRVVFALCALWCSTVSPVLAQHLNDTGQGNCHDATASTLGSDPETASFDLQNCTHEVAATVGAASAESASPQVSQRGMPEKPAGLDDAGWDSLKQAIRSATAQQATLMGDHSLPGADGEAYDLFGVSVALDGDTALVGAYHDAVGTTYQGSAYVFTRSGSTWTQQAKLTAGDGAAGDRFGVSVALDGDTALVGAYYDKVGANDYQGSVYVFTRSGSTWTQQAKLTAGDGRTYDLFGASVALDGNTALVGAYGDDVGVNGHQGSAYVFTRSGSTWTQQAKLVAGDGAITDRFGFSVTLDGGTALVGAYGDDVGVNGHQGSAYVFTRSGSTWTQQAKLVADDGAPNDYFGASVALDGNTALVGAYGDDVGVNSDQGSAYVFTRSGATWTQQAKLVAGDGAEGDEFGSSVALDGDTALVGAIYDDVSSSNQGSAYVFTRSGTKWMQQAKLTAGDAAAGDLLGRSVALDGDTALVGAYTDDVGAISDQGSAYVFTRSGSTWTQQAKLTAGNGAMGDRFGISVALDGDTALVGARGDEVGVNSGRGSAYVFTRSGDTWTQEAKLTAGDGAAGDRFGSSVALDGDTALVGAIYDDVSSNQGSAYVFTRSGTKWMQQAKLTAGDGANSDEFGWSVALDGDTALVGAYDAKVGANSDQGSAYVFTRSGNTWAQEAKLTAGDGAAYDQFGWSVALDGDTALVGAYADNVGANIDQGSAYVFTRSGSTWTQESKLTAGDGVAGDLFGVSVASTSTPRFVGRTWTRVPTIPGSAYVFTRIGTAWMQQAKLTAGDGAVDDEFGFSVALEGDTALVGAHYDTAGANSYQGSAYVFTRSGTTWTQQKKLVASDGAANDYFGRSVALSSTMALVGAPNVDGLPPYGNPDEGAAYVFRSVLGVFANGFEEPARAITVPRR